MEREFISIKEVAEKWNISLRQVQMYCKDNRIPGAKKIGNSWVVPAAAQRPENIRNLTGEERLQKIKHFTSYKDKVLSQGNESKFLYIMSQEIRNTLNAILGYSQRIADQKDDPESVVNYTQIIHNSGNSMLNLVNNISDLIKLDRKELKLEEHIYNVEALISKATEARTQDCTKHNIKIDVKSDITNEFVIGDEEKILKIINCIIDNSIKFSQDGSSIYIKIVEEPCEKDGFCKVNYIIRDKGIGITESKLESIQDNFTKKKIEPATEYNGLGLVTAYQFTKFLGGNFIIDSQFGSGTTVTLSLDQRKADLSNIQNLSSSNDDNDERKKLKGRRILVADDNEINREIIKEILSTAGVRCDTAEDGIICIAMLEQHPEDYYDLILMDLKMPNLDGFLATVLIRRLDNKAKSSIPIVALTANVQTENREYALNSGMNGFIEKPFDSNKLFKVIENCILHK
ncbi:MAG: response regulator [Treponema sp.]|nr:response regulator [Treponema sp.]